MKICVHAYVAAAVTTAGVVGGAYAAYRVYKRFQVSRLPQKWKQVGTLKDIYVYPVKSCGAVVLDRAECCTLGLRNGWLRDRVLMVTDEKSNFITARAYPELLKISPTVKSSILTMAHPDMEPLRVNLSEIIELNSSPKTAYVWGVGVPVLDCGWEASEWLSRILDRSAGNFRLSYYASHKSRPIRQTNASKKFYTFGKNDTGALPDEVPFNLINEASVDDLNKKLKDTPVTPCNFRPNFVLKGAEPYDEDNYKFVKIGENIFEIIKPCGRCVLTTIDPETGVRNAKNEPLQTLKSYRQYENPEERRAAGSAPRMGVQMALRSGPGGFVSLNDPICFA